MKRFLTMLLVLAMSVACLGYAVAETPDSFTVVFSVKTPSNDTFQTALATSIQTAVEAAGGEFTLMGAGSANNVATQVTQLEDAINKGVQGLVVNPLDSNAVIPALQLAKEKNIPVVIVDTPLPAGNEDLYVAYVGTDNYNAGYLAGQAMAEKLGGAGQVALVRGANGNAAGDGRADGFKAGIAGTGLELVSEQVGNWSNAEAMQATENMLQANPEIKGIFSCSDVMVEGILQAYSDNNFANADIVTIAVDGAVYAVDWVENGDIYATMAQFPAKMGTIAVDLICQALAKADMSATEKNIDSGVMLVTKDTAAEYRPNAF